MKSGKQHIYELPISDITTLGVYADQMQREAEASGKPLPAAVRLHIGEPNFRTPAHIRQAAIESIQHEPLTYGPAEGWPWLRELLAEKIARINGYNVQPSQTVIGMGGTGAIQSILLATVGPGDEVLIPDPCWPHYGIQMATAGATTVSYPLDPANAWLPDIQQMEKLVTPRTRMLIINTPGNPTGAVFPRNVVHQLLEFARRHDLYLLSDECYDEMVFEGEHVSAGTMLERGEFEEGRFIGVYTFSKTYAMTGWRVGYLTAGTKLIKTITEVLNGSITNVSTPMQRAAAAALQGPRDCIGEMCSSYQQRRDIAVALLKEYGRYAYTPHGAFYLLINVQGRNGESRQGRNFALDLVREYNVTVTPGHGFGSVSADYVRVSLAATNAEIERGVRAICELANR